MSEISNIVRNKFHIGSFDSGYTLILLTFILQEKNFTVLNNISKKKFYFPLERNGYVLFFFIFILILLRHRTDMLTSSPSLRQ